MQDSNLVNQEKILDLIKYSSPTDIARLSVVVDPVLTSKKKMFNNCTALRVGNGISFATFERTPEQIDYEIIRSEIGKLLGITMPDVCRISTADKTKEGLIIDTNLTSNDNLNIASQVFSDKKALFMKMDKASAQAMNDFIAYFPTEEDLKNPQTTFAMLLKGVTSLPYNQITNQTEQRRFIEEYYDMIVLDLLTGQKKRNGEDYYYYTEMGENNTATTGHIIPGLLNYSWDNGNNSQEEYYLNDFPVNIDTLMDKLFANGYPFIKRVVDSLISSIVDYKDCISRIIYNNTSIENAQVLEEMIFHNIDRFVAKAHSTKKLSEQLSKIEQISTTTKINLAGINRIIAFRNRYPSSKQEILKNNDKIIELERNKNGDYTTTMEEEGIKLTLNNPEELAPTGYASSGMLSALIAFVCGLGIGLAYIISHLK